MIINSNYVALNAFRKTEKQAASLEKNIKHLASGSRINMASDDAAGLAISENMKAQIRGLNQAA
ncbi:Flagellar filament 33 kDa core protein [compost metagenome]